MAKVFKHGKMMSDVVDSALTNAKADTPLDDGALVVLGNLAADSAYAGKLEYDTYEATAPVAATDEVVIVDYAGISEGTIAGNQYKIGIKLHNLVVPAGTITRVRRLYLHDKFWLGGDNFDSTPTVGEYATAKAGSTAHTPAAVLPQTGYAVKVLVENDMTVGMHSEGKIYLVEVVQL